LDGGIGRSTTPLDLGAIVGDHRTSVRPRTKDQLAVSEAALIPIETFKERSQSARGLCKHGLVLGYTFKYSAGNASTCYLRLCSKCESRARGAHNMHKLSKLSCSEVQDSKGSISI
jgi:hypothetical protein